MRSASASFSVISPRNSAGSEMQIAEFGFELFGKFECGHSGQILGFRVWTARIIQATFF